MIIIKSLLLIVFANRLFLFEELNCDAVWYVIFCFLFLKGIGISNQTISDLFVCLGRYLAIVHLFGQTKNKTNFCFLFCFLIRIRDFSLDYEIQDFLLHIPGRIPICTNSKHGIHIIKASRLKYNIVDVDVCGMQMERIGPSTCFISN